MKLIASMWVALFIAFGCSTTKDITRTGENSPPSIRLTFNKLAVPIGQTQVLTVSVSDADRDTLYVVWKKTGGTFNDLDQGKTSMRWIAPSTIEIDTIVATVTDGESSKSATLILKTGTPVISDINGTRTWNLAGSPYIVSPLSDVFTISQGALLIVNPGVEIYVDKEESSIRVEGEFRVNGQPSSPVIIIPNRRGPYVGFWGGIQVVTQVLPGGGGGSVGKLDLSYSYVSHGVNDIMADNNTSVFLDGCRLTNAEREGLLFLSTGVLDMRNSEVSNNGGDGISLIKYSGFPESVVIANSRIVSNESSGISITVRDTTGIAPIEITGDTISFNKVHGIHIALSAYPLVRDNAIFLNDISQKNDGYGIHIAPGFNGPVDLIDARCNYWGYWYVPADSGKVSDFIYDGNDDGSINARVKFVPWLNDYPEACSL